MSSASSSSSSSSSLSTLVRADLKFNASQRGGSAFWANLFERAAREQRPAFCLAPLHESSDLPLRVLVRTHGQVDFAFTPMIHARMFCQGGDDAPHRNVEFCSDDVDRPLVVQFAGCEADDIIAAARIVQHRCDAIDINLGCPQTSARQGNYGAFLCEQPDKCVDIIRKFRASDVQLPLWIKMRVFDSLERTLEVARMFEAAGVSLITVHGRTRHQIGRNRGDADESKIAAVARALSIPVIANGNVVTRADALRIGRETGTCAVMAGWQILHENPFLFCQVPPTTVRCDFALMYLATFREHPDQASFARRHVFEWVRPLVAKHAPGFFDLLGKIDQEDIGAYEVALRQLRDIELKVNATNA